MLILKPFIKLFRYIEPLWLGTNKKFSIRRALALWFSWDFANNMSFVIHKWEIGKSYAEVAMLLGLEAGLIAALMSLTTYSASLVKQTNPPSEAQDDATGD
jgi:hypothetical protein